MKVVRPIEDVEAFLAGRVPRPSDRRAVDWTPVPAGPDDDLYARLEVTADASPEAIELAWRALPQATPPRRRRATATGRSTSRSGSTSPTTGWATRTCAPVTTRSGWALGPVAPDGARRPGYRPRRLRRPLGPPAGVAGRRRAGAHGGRRAPTSCAATPAERLARFLGRVERLTPDELDRLAAAEPPPIAFLGDGPPVPDAGREGGLRRGGGRARPARAARPLGGGRAPRGAARRGRGARARRRSSTTCSPSPSAGGRASACCGPGTRRWTSRATAPTGTTSSRSAIGRPASPGTSSRRSCAPPRGSPATIGPWPEALDREEDEALRISALLAARDVAGAVPVRAGLAPAVATPVPAAGRAGRARDGAAPRVPAADLHRARRPVERPRRRAGGSRPDAARRRRRRVAAPDVAPRALTPRRLCDPRRMEGRSWSRSSRCARAGRRAARDPATGRRDRGARRGRGAAAERGAGRALRRVPPAPAAPPDRTLDDLLPVGVLHVDGDHRVLPPTSAPRCCSARPGGSPGGA